LSSTLCLATAPPHPLSCPGATSVCGGGRNVLGSRIVTGGAISGTPPFAAVIDGLTAATPYFVRISAEVGSGHCEGAPHIHSRTHLHTCIHSHTHLHTCIHSHTHLHIRTHMHSLPHTYTLTRTHTYTLTHAYTYAHTYTHAHTLSHTHTYTHTPHLLEGGCWTLCTRARARVCVPFDSHISHPPLLRHPPLHGGELLTLRACAVCCAPLPWVPICRTSCPSSSCRTPGRRPTTGLGSLPPPRPWRPDSCPPTPPVPCLPLYVPATRIGWEGVCRCRGVWVGGGASGWTL
jgi:hypothetical protein